MWRALPGRPLRTLVTGAPRDGAPAAVVVPGLGAVGYLLPAVERLAARTRVTLLDVPGFGARRTARCPSRLADVVDVVLAVVREAAAPVLLVGHSTGAQAALHVAGAEPAAVAAVVASGVTFPPALRRARPLAAAAARTLRHEHPRELLGTVPQYARGRGRVLELLRTALADRPEDVVPDVRRPVVVVRGQRDRLCDAAWARDLAGAAPSGRLVELPGAHNTASTHPAETAAAWWSATATGL